MPTGWSGGAFVQIRRQGDASGLEDAADLAGDGGAGGNALAVLRDGCLLETVEIAQPWLFRSCDVQKTQLIRFAADSSLEGDGFEPSVPAKFFGCPVDPPAIHLPQYKPAPSRQGPMVRIHLSSGESTNHRFLPDFIPLGSGGKRLEMLCQPEGATVDEVASVTGWQRHTVRGVFSGSLRGYRCAQ